MERHEIEFSEGQEVTFNAYGIPLKGIVKVVDCMTFNKDERVFYYIRGNGIVSKCTGLCIEESKYFQPFLEK